MGFIFRKSIKTGPFRFNLSGSGIGMSVGVKGLRFGTGPRGNYVRIGHSQIYYQRTEPPQPGVEQDYLFEPGAHGEMISVQTDCDLMVQSSNDAIAAEINQKRRYSKKAQPYLFLLFVVAFFVSALHPIVGLLTFFVGFPFYFVLRQIDINRSTVVLCYDFEDGAQSTFERFCNDVPYFLNSALVWNILSRGEVFDSKYHAGADSLVDRISSSVLFGQPELVACNLDVLTIRSGKRSLYFLPDRLLVYSASGVFSVSYNELQFHGTTTEFVEDGVVAHDAQVIDTTWKYVNKSGGPDRRFNDNREIPICLYDVVTIWTESGLRETFYFSRVGTAKMFSEAIRTLRHENAKA